MRADDVRACLTLRWPDSEYLHVPEAPQDSSRQGRKLDVLVLALWKSRGLHRFGVEIKVSASDWRRELKEPAKAEWWWRHVHQFYVAVPTALAATVKAELPPTWGLLVCSAGKAPDVVVQAPFHEPEDFSWPAQLGIMRAASDCGINALQRAESRGREEGRKAGREEAERRSPDGAAKAELERLRQQISEFEEASGLNISDRWADMARIGTAVALLRKEQLDPGWVLERLRYPADHLASAAKNLTTQANRVGELAARLHQLAAGDGELDLTTEVPRGE